MSRIKSKKILIIGCGFAGRAIAEEIRNKGILGHTVAFVDDNPDKIGQMIDGLPVYGPIKNIDTVIEKTNPDEALIAIPSAKKEDLKKIYRILKDSSISRIRILPGISQIIEGEAHLIQTREIYAQDLLARDPVIIPLKESLNYLRGKRVVITGAGGSIGSELSRQLLSGGAERLYLLDHSENNAYEIEKELRLLQEEGVGEKATIVPVVGDLQDREYVFFIIKRLKADVIFHCAAYKHVPLMEANPIEVIKNNVFGTKNIVDAAKEAGTPKFVLISTDKAVNPESIYGASKLLAENLVLRETNHKSSFMVVRFGNVLGSKGSIVPLFISQIKKGGPVTITHPDMKRFFMTIPEAASLVLKTGGVGKGGELYILDMGEPVYIKDLAKQMIDFFGYTEKDIEIKYTGTRPGEKLFEKLWTDMENPQKTDYDRINKVEKAHIIENINELIKELEKICYHSNMQSPYYRNRRFLRKTLNSYIPTIELNENEPEY